MGIKVFVVLYKENGKQKVATYREEPAAKEFLENKKGRIIASHLNLGISIRM